MASRSSYWCNGTIANIIRGSAKPNSATGAGWDKWELASKEKHPVRYWIVEEGFDMVQKFIYWPADKLGDLKCYLRNRFVTKTHALTSLSLKRGQWAEIGTRMLHCNFDELVNFVEIETASSHIAWGEKEDRKKYNVSRGIAHWWPMRQWRCAQAGLDHLYWAASLVYDSSMGIRPGSPMYGQLTSQAERAKETLALYHWWKNVFPSRPDIHDASGLTAVYERRRIKDEATGITSFLGSGETPEERIESDAAMSRCNEIEAAYEKEDEEMLIRLVKLSSNLWT